MRNYKFNRVKILFTVLIFEILFLIFNFSQVRMALSAGPASTNFQLNEYGFGAGGVATSSSQSFLFQGILGEMETASLSSQNFLALPGLTYTLEPNTPGAPTFTNPSNYYNKLHIIINYANNPADTTFVIQISSGSANFSSNVYYVQADNTLGTGKVWQSYASWGSGSGVTLIGLIPGTTYYARVAAKRGVYQEGIYGPSANAATINPTLTFSLETTTDTTPPYTLDIGGLSAGSITTSSDKAKVVISTNATNGGLIYLYGANAGLKSTTAGNYNISSVSNNLSSIAEGYGARGTTTTQTSGGPMQLVSPYNGAGENVGLIDTSKRQIADSSNLPVTGGEIQFELKAKITTTTPSANDYADILTVIATGSF